MVQITKDNAYDAVAPDDFPGDAGRRALRQALHRFRQDHLRHARSFLGSARQEIHRLLRALRSWRTNIILPDEFFPIFQTRHRRQADERRSRSSFANQSARWSLSSILHGEQGALALSASLCHILRDPGAQEYAANQTREEARHVTAFAAYIKARWGKPLPCGPALQNLLTEIVASPRGLEEDRRHADAGRRPCDGRVRDALSEMRSDPLLVKLCQLVMTDEAFHHKFGKIWADRTIPNSRTEEHNIVEDWAAQCSRRCCSIS